jgi:YVTN family beta-propeller protein
VSPDGATAYLANGDESSISEIEIAALPAAGTPIEVGSKPLSIAVHPTSGKAYVTNRSSDKVSVVDMATHNTESSIRVGDLPEHVVLAPGEDRGYVANLRGCTTTVIDTADDEVDGKPIKVHAYPAALALSPDDGRLYVATAIPNTGPPQCADSVDPSQLIVVNTGKRKVAGTLVLPAEPFDIALGPGNRLYATLNGLYQVVVMDTSTGATLSTLPVGVGPTDIAASPDGGRLYVANGGSGTISVIDTSVDQVVETIPVPS